MFVYSYLVSVSNLVRARVRPCACDHVRVCLYPYACTSVRVCACVCAPVRVCIHAYKNPKKSDQNVVNSTPRGQKKFRFPDPAARVRSL